VLDALFVTPAATAIMSALGASAGSGLGGIAPSPRAGAGAGAGAGGDGPVAVIGNARIARAIGTAREVIPVGLSARAAKKLPRAIADLSGVEPASLAAVIGIDLATDDDWQSTLRGWSRVVRDGGMIVFVDRGHPHEAGRRALCGGLSEIEQRHVGRSVITSGFISHL
jgi:hypothetical protein